MERRVIINLVRLDEMVKQTNERQQSTIKLTFRVSMSTNDDKMKSNEILI